MMAPHGGSCQATVFAEVATGCPADSMSYLVHM